MQTTHSSQYGRILGKLCAGGCVVLDGATATELPHLSDAEHAVDERLWGTRALVEGAAAVLDVHRGYVAAGCDVISTNTWGLPSALLHGVTPMWNTTQPVHWMDLARRGLRLAREAVADGGRELDCAVAFSINGDVDSDEGESTIRLLARLFANEPPDLILLETLTVVRGSLFATVQSLLDTGIPLWLSFRRCRHGLCSVYGQHWGGPEGDAFGRAAARFEQLGVGALMVNCIPPDHVDGMVSYLRDFTDMPLGVYPNLGYYTDEGWRFEPGVGSDEYAAMALRWRAEGAQIIGGCCGVGPAHVGAARKLLEQTVPGERSPAATSQHLPVQFLDPAPDPGPAWTDRRGRALHPLAFPDLVVDPGVAAPSSASLMAWRYLYDQAIGAHQRCLDVGCGTGILGLQLALNGASHVRAIDIDERAVRNTETNAHRNDVGERMTAARIDIFPWVPEERYEVIVACVDQTPVDPEQQVTGHRPIDYWGRTPLDPVLTKLADALAPEGVAYVVQLSILSQRRTSELLAAAGLEVRVVEYGIFPFPPELEDHRAQIGRVERLSDADHPRAGDRDLLVAYLLEIRRRP
ncbi:MAG TPA: homocysteine S-methyltransferase family protein [Solirubrobacteraceae bacterium]|nr:homocysteine S-methyltransferase family protein [Solirubrobacteraceae bacterium]